MGLAAKEKARMGAVDKEARCDARRSAVNDARFALPSEVCPALEQWAYMREAVYGSTHSRRGCHAASCQNAIRTRAPQRPAA